MSSIRSNNHLLPRHRPALPIPRPIQPLQSLRPPRGIHTDPLEAEGALGIRDAAVPDVRGELRFHLQKPRDLQWCLLVHAEVGQVAVAVGVVHEVVVVEGEVGLVFGHGPGPVRFGETVFFAGEGVETTKMGGESAGFC